MFTVNQFNNLNTEHMHRDKVHQTEKKNLSFFNLAKYKRHFEFESRKTF